MSYVPTDWQEGDIISAERLNHLENGIQDACYYIVLISYNAQHLEQLSATWNDIYDAIQANKIIRFYSTGYIPMIQDSILMYTVGSGASTSYVIELPDSNTKYSTNDPDEYPVIHAETNCFGLISDTDFNIHVYYYDYGLEYSTDRIHWTEWDGSTIYSSNGELYLRGTERTTTHSLFYSYSSQCIDGSNISLVGNIETLLDYQAVARGEHPTMDDGCYNDMFYGSTSIVDASQLVIPSVTVNSCEDMFKQCTSLTNVPQLPATTLADGCYDHMFQGCTSLTDAPDLPAMTLANGCYDGMFQYCSSLTTAPDLSATTLVDSCYRNMFFGCTSLTSAPDLPATTLADGCYDHMFYNCSALTSAPDLPATTLAEDCYNSMFRGCSSLTTPPDLPATTLEGGCYDHMFYECTSLTTVPLLPATTLADDCYNSMFRGCTSLTTLPELPATTLAANCYKQMFYQCSGIKLSTTETGEYINEYRIPSTDTGVDASNALTSMFTSTGGTFTGTPVINTTYYTSNRIVKSEYITFKGSKTFTLSVWNQTKNWDGILEYSTDKTTWTTWDGTQISSSASYELYVRGSGNTVITGDSSDKRWYSSALLQCNGNIESLLDHETVTKGGHPTMGPYCFKRLFYGCSLVSPPDLPGTNLSEGCYEEMFRYCRQLTSAPKLPATTLAKSCYSSMFNFCTSLVTPPELPATTLADYCYSGMFYECTALTRAPDLSATILAQSCYSNMFLSCLAITTPPALPATTLAPNCYEAMFSGCPITKLPQLPATTLAEQCYIAMFSGCKTIKLSTTRTNECIYEFRVPTSGTGTTAPNALTVMFTNTSGTFAGTPTINTTYYSSIPTADLPFLSFNSTSSFTLGTQAGTKSWDGTLEYSTDASQWTTWNGDTISSSPSGSLFVRGTGNSNITGGSYPTYLTGNWVLTGSNIVCDGNIENLLDYATVADGGHPSMGADCYAFLFKTCTALKIPPQLPATTLAQECYYYMFNDCTALEKAPQLPATTLAVGCYVGMFSGCSSLTVAPDLPATTLTARCYTEMFMNCTSLIVSPNLPATTAPDMCYTNMFNSCTALTTPSLLPATTLGSGCYQGMFRNCSALTTAPDLPATTLTGDCYSGMFDHCTSIVSAPKISATTVADSCCEQMFYYCTALTSIPALLATTLEPRCYYAMFQFCSSIMLSTSKTGVYQTSYRIPISETGTVGTNSLKNMFNNTGGTFTSTPTINTTYYTSNVVVS